MIKLVLLCVAFATFAQGRNYSPRVCLNTMSDGCLNGGLVDAGNDEESLGAGTPGKRSLSSARCLNTMSDGCLNGGLVDAGTDEESLAGGGTPGKRAASGRVCLNTMSDGCDAGGLVDAGNDHDALVGGNTPGKRDLAENLRTLRYLEAARYCQNDRTCIYYYLKMRPAEEFYKSLGIYLG